MSNTRIVMVQEISGLRADGRSWPPPGVEFEVDADEARSLTHIADGSSTPLAKYAEKRTETADAKTKPVETREDKDDEEKYAKGGVIPEGSSLVTNETDEPEKVGTPDKPKQSRPGAGKSKQ